MLGSVFIYSPSEIFAHLLAGRSDNPSSQAELILWEFRLPRAAAAALVGASLAMTGACFQSLFRNPLADPYIVGVSSGAAVGGVLAITLGISWGIGSVALAFATAVAGLAAVVMLARVGGALSLATLLMAGVGVGSFLWALITFILVSSGQDSGKVLFWLLGSFVGSDWSRVAVLAASTAVFGGALFSISRPLTVFSVGEESSSRLGVETERLKWIVLLAGSALAATAVACVGIIGFVGLFVPHIARRYIGPDLRALMPACALLGAAAVITADLIAQRALYGREINVGIVTAIIGAPFLILAMRRKQ